MYHPDFDEFCELAKTNPLVPVFREFLADLETPVSTLAHFADDENVFLLESVEGGERLGRYSFIGLNPYSVFTVENGKAFIASKDGKNPLPESAGKGFFALRSLMKDHTPVQIPGLPPLFGGAAGYMAYELVNEFEPKLPPPQNNTSGPQACFMLTDEMIIFDNLRHTVMIPAAVKVADFNSPREAYQNAISRIEAIHQRMNSHLETPVFTPDANNPIRLKGNLSREEYAEMVEKGKEHIREGDIIQVVLARKLRAKCTIPAIQLYRALRLVNPSPYTFFLKTGTRTLIGSSPETMVKLENGIASLRPIAGTRKRGSDEREDRKMADELLRDEKERAEHLMLVDLGRNDLGRVAKPGSVQVRSFMNVERFSHVMHLVSNVESVLLDNLDAFDLAASAFPAGTLSGAPKIRAMEIIRELEGEPRGTYGGAAGYFSSSGNMDLAITIRTITLDGEDLTIGAGAGIVADSDPDSEYDETMNKARALFSAIKLAENGLNL